MFYHVHCILSHYHIHLLTGEVVTLQAQVAAEAARVAAAAEAEQAEAARLAAQPVSAMPDLSDSTQYARQPPPAAPAAVETNSQTQLMALSEGLPPPGNQRLFRLGPEPKPELQQQSRTPRFDFLMEALHPQTRAEIRVSSDIESEERARLAAATARSLMASPKNRTMVAEEQLQSEHDADLMARCVYLRVRVVRSPLVLLSQLSLNISSSLSCCKTQARRPG